MTSTAFPSERTKELYATLKGRRTLIESGLQTAENEAFLQSKQGRLARAIYFSDTLSTIVFFGSVAGLPVAINTFISVGGFFHEGISSFEAASAGGGAAALGAIMWGAKKLVRAEDRFQEARPADVRKELFEHLKSDLESINFSVLSSDGDGLSFTTQRGVVVAGENDAGELVMLLNGLPMRASYEKITPAPTEFITSVTGQKIPVGTGIASI